MTLRHLFALILTALTAVACTRPSADTPDLLWDGGEMRVTAGDITVGERNFTFEPDSTPVDHPWFHSQFPSLDATFNSGAATFESLEGSWNYGTEDISEATAMSFALLDPYKAMEMLRTAAADFDVTGPQWPVVGNRHRWISAAWEVYLATGDEAWLDELTLTGLMIMERDLTVTFDRSAGLLRGLLDHVPVGTDISRAATLISLETNVNAAAALTALSRASALKGYTDLSRRLAATARIISEAVNENFWIPERGYYSAALDGAFYPIATSNSDSRAIALAVLDGVTTREMAESAISSTPVLQSGAPAVYPSARYTLSPVTQALWAMASRKTLCEQGMLAGIGSSMALTASATADGSPMSPGDAGAATAGVLRTLAGIQLSDSGMTVMPVIPGKLAGEKRLNGLRYRDMTLDIVIRGTGSHIAGFLIDGEASPGNFIPADLDGHHEITVTMANNLFPEMPLNISSRVSPVPVPVMRWTSDAAAVIANHRRGDSYRVWINGVLFENTAAERIEPGVPRRFEVRRVTATDRDGIESLPSAADMFIPAGDSILIHRSAIPHDLRKAIRRRLERLERQNRNRRRNRRVLKVPEHLEMSRLLNTELDVTVSVPADGTYFVDLNYWRPAADECLLTSLAVNDSTAGAFVMPANSGFTNPLRARFRKGRNTLRLVHVALPDGKDNGAACLEYIRLIKTTDKP